MQAGNNVMVRYSERYSNTELSPHKVYSVAEVYRDGSMLLKGFPEPVSQSLFEVMRVGKVRAH